MLQITSRFNQLIGVVLCLVLIAWSATALGEEEAASPAIEASQVIDDDGSMSNSLEQEKPDWFGMAFLDIAMDTEDAAAEGKHFGLYFYQDGCPYCEKLIDDNFGQYQINEYAKANFNIAPINIFGSVEVTDLDGGVRPESAFAKHRDIQFTPTMIFFALEGEVFRMNGYYPPHKFLAMLEYIKEKYYLRNITFIDFMKTKELEPASNEMHYSTETLRPPVDMAAQTLGEKKPVLVLFEQPRCLACDELHLDILKREANKVLHQQFDTVLINVFGDEEITPPNGSSKITETEWARKIGIKYTPSLVFFEQRNQGQSLKEVFRTEGYLKSFHIQSAMDYVLSAAYAKPQDFQKFLSDRAEAMRPEDGHLDIMH